ncbi:MAG TPA: MlaD family protein [Thermoleophilaceae bacterium]|nr:MlaD family protein [Thermoleophilaceae bacterium]
MRRLALVALSLAGLVVVLAGARDKPSGARVDAIFDNTASLIPGQDVKIAGARVGSVSGIHLTPDRRARVEMEVETGFAPFRADATCAIRPASLIGEKFIQCDPGSPDAGALPAGPSGAPTVPLERTRSPVDLDLVFAALRRPYSERISIIVSELGAGLAGRPGDLNAAIRRANPALAEANEVLRILDRDRATLARLVASSDLVLSRLAAKDTEAGELIDSAATASRAIADRRDDLDEAIRRLPPLLDELEPSAAALSRLARDGAPVARDLRASAPFARALFADLDPLSDAATPALVELGRASRTGRRAVRAARPVADALAPVAALLPPLARTATEVVTSLRESGGVEGLQLFVYYGALATSRFDRLSHILPSYQVASQCQQYATTPVEHCSAHFGGGPGPASRPRERERAAPRRTDRPRRPAAPAPPPERRAEEPPAREPRRPRLPLLPEATEPVQQLLDYLLGP